MAETLDSSQLRDFLLLLPTDAIRETRGVRAQRAQKGPYTACYRPLAHSILSDPRVRQHLVVPLSRPPGTAQHHGEEAAANEAAVHPDHDPVLESRRLSDARAA